MSKNDTNYSRRQFLEVAGAGAGLAMIGCYDSTAGPAGSDGGKKILSAVDSYAVDSVTVQSKLFIIRDTKGFAARSAICTHQGCQPAWTGVSFDCPCHGSRYNRDGSVINGPAPRPLPSYQVTIEEGAVVVDTGVEVPADQYTSVA